MTKVLVVDDAVFIRHIIRKSLSENGYSVIEASDGFEAINQYINHKPDIIFLDIIMPNMDGVETLKAIRAFGGVLPIVMLSSVGIDPSLIGESRKYGAADLINKPFKEDTILNYLRNFPL